MNGAVQRAASVLLVLLTAYVAYSVRESAYRAAHTPERVLAECIEATYGTTTEAMQRVYGYVPNCI